VDKIWKLQEEQTKVYNIVNDAKLLRSMCRYIPDDAKIQINKQLKNVSDIEEAKRIYRAAIMQHQQQILSSSDNDAYRTVILHPNFNPRILLIFDDCIASGAKEINKSVEQIAFEGRHRHITFFLATQYETRIDKALRENAHFSIFCSKIIGTSVIRRFGLEKSTEKQLLSAMDVIFPDSSRLDTKAVFTGSSGGEVLPYKVLLHDKFTVGCDIMIRLYKKLVELEEKKKKSLYD
jgi:hypothetical protein